MKTTMRMASAVVLALAGAASAQTSELYIFSYTSNQAYVVQNGNLNRSFATGTYEFAGAVAGDVRTVQAYSWVGQDGKQYDTNGNDLGGRYAYTGLDYIYDATTDGANYNYACLYGGGDLYRFDRNWQNAQFQFSTAGNTLGTAYDTSNNTIWTAAGSGAVSQYDLNGQLLSQFFPGGNWYGLALDPADGTLWLTQDGSYPYIAQYDQSGNHLQDVYVGNFGMGNTLGMEFDVGRVPAPGAAALLGIGGLAASRRRRA